MQTPALNGIPRGSHAWCFCGSSALDELNGDVLKAWLDPALVSPVHPVASRIVTSHCDLHQNNVLNVDGGAMMCIDFEYACVTYAVFDLALGVAMAGRSGDMENRRVFIKSYLESMDEPFESEHVEALAFEAELARACYLHGVLQPSGLRFCPQTALAVISAMKSFVTRARASAELRAEVMQLGFRRSAEMDDAMQRATEAHGKELQKYCEELVGGHACHSECGEQKMPEAFCDRFDMLVGLPILGGAVFP